MRINYNVTGEQRKSMVAEISSGLGAPTKYLGMPTAAYEVGGYHIDKTGTVTGEDNRLLVADLLEAGFKPVSEEYDEPQTQSEQAPAQPECPDILTIEMPLDGFTPEKLDNLAKMVTAKAPLLKAALGADDLPIKQTAETLQSVVQRGNRLRPRRRLRNADQSPVQDGHPKEAGHGQRKRDGRQPEIRDAVLPAIPRLHRRGIQGRAEDSAFQTGRQLKLEKLQETGGGER